MPLRTIAVDFNSFFVSCEQQERPVLRGRPVAVVPVNASTTCCISVNYVAKAQGVRAEMGAAEAKQCCPELVLVEARPEVYIKYHRRLLDVIESCIHISEIKSIDEVSCELTATFSPLEKALGVARQIKAKVSRRVGACLTSSIGIAPNWFLAKLASDMQKPNGLIVIDDADLPQKLLDRELRDFLGVGSRMETRLNQHGIHTAAQLCAAPKAELRGIWGGVEGERMYARLRGEAVPLERVQHQSVSHSHVLPPMLRTEPKALAVLHRLLQKAALRLRHINHYAGGLSVFVRYRDSDTWEDDLGFNPTQDTLKLTHALTQLWARRPAGLKRRQPIHVGLVLNHLLAADCHTPDLFEQQHEVTRGRLHDAMDLLNQTYGNGSVYYGGAFGATENAPMRISFTCIPKPELEEIDPNRGRRVRPLSVPAPDECQDN